jgi:hypothetical protein
MQLNSLIFLFRPMIWFNRFSCPKSLIISFRYLAWTGNIVWSKSFTTMFIVFTKFGGLGSVCGSNKRACLPGHKSGPIRRVNFASIIVSSTSDRVISAGSLTKTVWVWFYWSNKTLLKIPVDPEWVTPAPFSRASRSRALDLIKSKCR